MKNFISFVILLFFAITLFAQEPCNDEMIMAIKGKWSNRPASQMTLAQALVRVDKMQNIIQGAYPEPKGIEPRWYQTTKNKSLIGNGPEAYQLTTGFFDYYCNKNVKKMLLGGETATWIYVYANYFNWFLDEIKEYIIQNQPVYLLRKKTGEIKGYPVYEGNYNQRSNTGTYYSRTIILTRAGQLPYMPVSKKQFLTAYINFAEKLFRESLSQTEKNIPVRTDAQEEEYKKQQLAKIERTTAPEKIAKAKDLFLRTHVSDKQSKATSIDAMKKHQDETLKPARMALSNSTAEILEQPAVLGDGNPLEFKSFVPEDKGRMIVRLNPAYFDMKLPKYVPQFLIAYWQWSEGTAQNYWRQQVEKNFDFDALKAMIDK